MGGESGENLRLIRQALSTHQVIGRPFSGPLPPEMCSQDHPAMIVIPFCSEELVGSVEHSVLKQGDGSLDLRISMGDQGGKG